MVSHDLAIADCYAFVKANRYAEPAISAGMKTPHERLRAARIAAGFESAADAARAMGEHPQNVRDQEANRRKISPEWAAKYAKHYGVSASHILFGPGHATDSGVSSGNDVRMVGVIGEVRAGVFAEIPDEEPEPWDHVPVSLPEYARASLFALQVVGRSMDRFYPDGSTVIVCPAHEAGVREGDHVVVRRRRGGLAETTLKEVVASGKGVELWPRSSDPAYQEPIRLESVRDADEGPEIVGVVVGFFMGRPGRSGPLLNL